MGRENFLLAFLLPRTETLTITGRNLMTTRKLCPICATDSLSCVPVRGTAPFFVDAEGQDIVGDLFLSTCQNGHVFLRIAAASNGVQSPWTIDIVDEGIVSSVLSEKWFGKPSQAEPPSEGRHRPDIAFALEAMSRAIEHIHSLVDRVWESSLDESDEEPEVERDAATVERKG